MTKSLARLYDEDFYAWTQDQAAALRALKGHNRLDVDRLAEEIEDLGKSELQAVESFVEHIIAHLLKLDYSGHSAPRNHWRAEVFNFRRNARRKMTPSMRPKLEANLEERYREGRELAAVSARPYEHDLERRLPKTCPYDWETIWSRDVMAEGGIELQA